MSKIYTSYIASRGTANRNISLEDIRSGSHTKDVSKEQSARIKQAGASALNQMRERGILTTPKR